MIKKINYSFVLETAVKAGEEIMQIYENENFDVEFKSDNSPLTKADKKAHNIIEKALKQTGIPVLSEESDMKDYSMRKDWDVFWLVDPLDGTKEFIKRNGDFTVNIALIENGQVMAGVVFVPVTMELYLGIRNQFSWKMHLSDFTDTENLYDRITAKEPLKSCVKIRDKFIVVGSRSHLNDETRACVSEYNEKYETEMLSRGSSLKFCMIAEGKAHFYPRLSPTMEWDTAAGHAIALAAGAEVIDQKTGKELEYNKENLLNPWFVVKPLDAEF